VARLFKAYPNSLLHAVIQQDVAGQIVHVGQNDPIALAECDGGSGPKKHPTDDRGHHQQGQFGHDADRSAPQGNIAPCLDAAGGRLHGRETKLPHLENVLLGRHAFEAPATMRFPRHLAKPLAQFLEGTVSQ